MLCPAATDHTKGGKLTLSRAWPHPVIQGDVEAEIFNDVTRIISSTALGEHFPKRGDIP